MSFEILDEMISLKMPQFKLREGSLYFLLAKRPHLELDADDVRLWSSIDGASTVGEIGHYLPDVESRLRRFLDHGVCEVAQAHFPANRKRVLVIEPHMDDAALSVGGLMWLRRETCEFCVVSVAEYSNFTSYYYRDQDFFDVPTVSELRKAESALVMRMLGGRHVTLGESEAPLRYQSGSWSLDWYRRHQKSVAAFTLHASSEKEVAAWATAIECVLATTDAQEIWLPLGIGYHTDHELTRSACLRALNRLHGLEQRKEVYFYEDVPYALRLPDHTKNVLDSIAAAGGVLERQHEDIGPALDGKLRLNSVFGSQFKLNYMADTIRESAKRASLSGDGCCELLFRVKATPGPIDELAAYSGKDEVESLIVQLRSWYSRHKSAKRIRILSPVAVGRWADDLSFLLEAFPNATIEVYVSKNYVAETDRLTSSRLEIRTVDNTPAAWMRQVIRLLFSWPHPLVFLTGEKKGKRTARFVKTICLLADPLITLRMNHLVLALRALKGKSEETGRKISEARAGSLQSANSGNELDPSVA